jgi:LmbE family N-acetylglucosaminyl deacetylase
VATLVCFHAHPDDEAIATAGTMALAADAGHRVGLVVATRGDRGEPAPGVLGDGEVLADRREAETRRSAEILGVRAVHFLGYTDSGMMGEDTNDDPACFWQADVDEAASRLADLLRRESADVLTVYDEWGIYGHPDHIQVHRVGTRAASLAGLDRARVFAATMNRDIVLADPPEELAEVNGDREGVERPDPETLGVPADQITHAVDVGAVVERKRAAMRAHASQITDEDFFLTLPDDTFRTVFGVEWYICLGSTRPPWEPFATDLLAEVDGS